MFTNNYRHIFLQPFRPFIGVSTSWFPNMMFKPSWMSMKTNPTQMKLVAHSTSFKGVTLYAKGKNCHEWHINDQLFPLPIGSLVAHTRKQMILTCLCQKGMGHQKSKGAYFNHYFQTLNLHCIWRFSVWKQWSMIIQTTIIGVRHLPTFTHWTPSFHSHLWFSTHL
jgi:hypothetical protein